MMLHSSSDVFISGFVFLSSTIYTYYWFVLLCFAFYISTEILQLFIPEVHIYLKSLIAFIVAALNILSEIISTSRIIFCWLLLFLRMGHIFLPICLSSDLWLTIGHHVWLCYSDFGFCCVSLKSEHWRVGS